MISKSIKHSTTTIANNNIKAKKDSKEQFKMNVSISEEVKHIMKFTLDKGHEIYLVGGSVRDQLLNKQSDDYDFTTSASPKEIKQIYSNFKIMDYGEAHGTISIYYKKKVYEITTFRKEVGYSDGRRPDKIEFVKDLKSDLFRRDFTINSLALDIDGILFDNHGGLEDFNNSIIRAVGNPFDRFSEDSLRILRAIRFALQLNFEIENETKEAIKKHSALISEHSISGERIFSELKEIFLFSEKSIKLFYELNILNVLFPKIEKYKFSQELLSKVVNLNDNLLISWALILFYSSNRGRNLITESKNIFSNYPGMAKADQFIVMAIIEFCEYTNLVNKHLNERQILRWLWKLSIKCSNTYLQYFKSLISEIINFSELINIKGANGFNQLRKIVSEKINIFPLTIKLNVAEVRNFPHQGIVIGDIIKQLERYYLSDQPILNQTLEYVYNALTKSQILNLYEIRLIISSNVPIYTFDENLELNDFLYEKIRIILTKFSEVSIIGRVDEFKYLEVRRIKNLRLQFFKNNKQVSNISEIFDAFDQKEGIIKLKVIDFTD